MVLAGLGICFIPHLPRPHLDPEVTFLLFLPPLLYAGAWTTSWRDFKLNLRPILLLAIGFVVFTTVVVAIVMHALIDGMTWPAAFTLGAIISPPDAVAATAIAHRLGVPRRLVTILEGESLVNDATGLTLYRFAVAAAVTGSFSLAHASERFVYAGIGGVALGLAVGWVASLVHRLLEEPIAETVITLLTPYASYIVAEAIGMSGVLAVVATGLFVSRQSSKLFSPALRVQALAVWDVVVFILNGLVFILIGLQLPDILREIEGQSWPQMLAYAALLSVLVVVARMIWMYPAAYVPRKLIPSIERRDPMPSWSSILFLGYTGMRGVDSLAAALGIPLTIAAGAAFPRRGMIIFLTFAVILSTLVIQSLTLPAIIRWLGLKEPEDEHCEECEARLRATRAALHRLEEIEAAGGHDAASLNLIRQRYQNRLERLADDGDENGKPDAGHDRHYRQMLSQAIYAERQHVIELRDREIISDEVLQRIQYDLDLEDLRLQETRSET
jgi:CPA1 family monovalent cation:H+ antiporter